MEIAFEDTKNNSCLKNILSIIDWSLLTHKGKLIECFSDIFIRQVKKEFALEQTFIMVKPDGVQRGLIGEVINRFEAKGFVLVALRDLTKNWSHHSLRVYFKATICLSI